MLGSELGQGWKREVTHRSSVHRGKEEKTQKEFEKIRRQNSSICLKKGVNPKGTCTGIGGAHLASKENESQRDGGEDFVKRGKRVHSSLGERGGGAVGRKSYLLSYTLTGKPKGGGEAKEVQ